MFLTKRPTTVVKTRGHHSDMDTRTFYDRISSAYDLLADASEGACRHQSLNMLSVATGERVLEIGSGTGRALPSLAAAVSPTGRVVGLDVSSGMMALARRAAANAARPDITLTLGDARALCFRDAMFDAVFISFTLELFEPADAANALAEIRRVLRPTGRLAVVAMAQTTSNAMTDIYTWLHRHFPHVIDCRPINVTNLLRSGGFRTMHAQLMSVWGLSVACVVALKEDAL
jgi:ubiquinone/menaquinone biosynthesis C-methylase UbiE